MAKYSTLARQFLQFAAVGAVATGIQYGILIIAVEKARLSAVLGSCTGFAVSAVVNYLLNYHFTFSSSNVHKVAAGRFGLVAALGLALNAVVMALFDRVLRFPYLVSQLAATAVVLIWNFMGNALWTFGPDKVGRTGEISETER